MNSNVFGQHIVWIEDTLHYCTTEPVTHFLISEHRQNQINKDKVLKLEAINTELKGKIDTLELIDTTKDEIIDEKDEIIEVVDEQNQLSKKELRRRKRKEAWLWVKNNYEKFLIGIGGTGLGVGIGYGLK